MEDRARTETAEGIRWSVPLGRIAGVTIRVHVTFIALVALVALSAGETGESEVAAVGWLGLLFACVVVHELAHALVARSKGIAAHEIDLLPIGGVSRLERIPDRWRDESAIAIAGPVASVGVALVAFALAAAAGLPLGPADLWEGPLLTRLAWVNLMLAGFNLLPAFPLDGGRVLRALLERDRTRVQATQLASAISRSLAALMIGFGVLYNLWLIVIGAFVLFAGRAEEAAVLLHAALGPTPARALVVPCPLSLPSTLHAGEAAALAGLHPQPAYPVIAPDGEPLGLVLAGTLRGATAGTPIGELAAGESVEASESLEAVAAKMRGRPLGVTEGGAWIGVITPEDLDAYLQQRLPAVGR
jgi:Zn-dependent protease